MGTRYPRVVRVVAMNEAEMAAESLMQAGTGGEGHVRPNVKLAFVAAITSANNSLYRNGLQTGAMRRYMMAHDGKLPTDVDLIKRLTREAGYEASANTALYISLLEYMDRAGALHELSIRPETAHEWLLWRESALRIKGIGYKTASFAALLLWPFQSPLVPCDRHVVARLAYTGSLQAATGYDAATVYDKISGAKTRANIALYRMVERLVGNEKLTQGFGRYSTAIYHWARWSEWRLFTGNEEDSKLGIESHDMLSPYWY